jgi:hypothetical protein
MCPQHRLGIYPVPFELLQGLPCNYPFLLGAGNRIEWTWLNLRIATIVQVTKWLRNYGRNAVPPNYRQHQSAHRGHWNPAERSSITAACNQRTDFKNHERYHQRRKHPLEKQSRWSSLRLSARIKSQPKKDKMLTSRIVSRMIS